MPKKKIEIDPVLSSVLSEDAATKSKTAPAKPRAAKKTSATSEPKKSKVVTHRHKKQEPLADVIDGVSALAAPTPEDVHNAIAAIAYSYYEGRGYQPGVADEDWLRAEREFWSRL